MQDTKSHSKIDLSEYYSSDNLSDLFQVFPKLKPNINHRTNVISPNGKIYVDKLGFYQMILEKIKNYFEIQQSFIISKSISIMLNDIKSIASGNNIKEIKNFPKTSNEKPVNINKNLSKDIFNLKRNLSTKSNGKNKINEQEKRKAYKSFYDLDKEKSFCEIKNIYMNMDKNKLPKIKVVHFMNEDIKGNKKVSKEKTPQKKSNLKKTKSKIELNIAQLTDLNISNLNSGKTTSRSRKTSFNKSKRKSSMRKKSNGIKLKQNKESKIITNITNINVKKEILYDEIKLNDSSNNINDKNFDIFALSNKVGKGNVLPLIGNYIFNFYNFNEFMNLTKFRNWCEKISNGYINTNFYHNSLHAADIAHTCHIYFQEGLVNEKIGLNNKSICALFISCICHDFKHPGLNNNYLIETKHPLSLKYNDISVLENMHISETFNIINSDTNCNILDKLDNSEYKIFRKQMISCVLSTDMANHSTSLNFIKKCLKEDYIKGEEDNQNYMNLLIHSADISNPTKKFDIYFKWAKLVVEEFYYQGDKEKELGLKCSCDRNIVTIYKSQLGFIDYIITPFYGDFTKLFPKLHYLFDNVNENRKKIKMMEEEDNNNKK